ncbi:alpha/beta hydrolase [Alsobacter sp. R-9]
MTATLEGPRRPAQSGRVRSLVVLVHGYGADGNDLIELADTWAGDLPDTAFVAPHAPEPCGMAPMGRQWFALERRDPHEVWQGVVAARTTFDRFLDTELARFNLDDTSLGLVGFSQGTMMVLHAGLRRARGPAAIVGYSGLLAGPQYLAGELTAPAPVLLVHGMEDEVIPFGALTMSVAALAGAGVPCEWHACPGLGHGIDEDGLRHGGAFLAKSFAGGEASR